MHIYLFDWEILQHAEYIPFPRGINRNSTRYICIYANEFTSVKDYQNTSEIFKKFFVVTFYG